MTTQNAAPLVRVSVQTIFTAIDTDTYPVASITSIPGHANPLNPDGDQEEVFEVLQTAGGDPRALMRNRTGQVLDLDERDAADVLTFPSTSAYRSVAILPPSPHGVSAYQTIELAEPMSLDLLGRQHLTLSFGFVAQRLIQSPTESRRTIVHGYIQDGRSGRWADAEIFLDVAQNVTDIQIVRPDDV